MHDVVLPDASSRSCREEPGGRLTPVVQYPGPCGGPTRERLSCTGFSLSQETAAPEETTVGICHGPWGDPRGWVLSYERGTRVMRDVIHADRPPPQEPPRTLGIGLR